jgi:hypothetical protein
MDKVLIAAVIFVTAMMLIVTSKPTLPVGMKCYQPKPPAHIEWDKQSWGRKFAKLEQGDEP